VDKTNQIADAMSTVVLTSAANTVGGQNSANVNLQGIFAANTIAAIQELRGGGVTSSANLTITSNAHFTGANLSAATTYVNLQTTTALVSANTLVLSGTTANVTSNLYVKGTSLTVISSGRVGINTTSTDAALTVSGAANVSAALYVGTTTTLSGNVVAFSNVTFMSAGDPTVGTLYLGNTATRFLRYDGTKFIIATANLQVNGHITASGILTVGNTGIDGVNVAAFKSTYDTRNILRVFDVNGNLLFTM
jgi:hypothetical protein